MNDDDLEVDSPVIKNPKLSFLCIVQKRIIRNSEFFNVLIVSGRFWVIMTWKRQTSVGNCPAKKFRDFGVFQSIAVAVENFKFFERQKIHRVDSPFSEYYKKAMCDLEIYLRKGTGDKSRDHTDLQSLNLTASVFCE